MNSEFSRTENLIGANALEKLKKCHIAVFGVGGVGGFVVEALARAGVGTIDLIDSDCVDITNLNRQIIALHSTIGKQKVAVMRDNDSALDAPQHCCLLIIRIVDIRDIFQNRKDL